MANKWFHPQTLLDKTYEIGLFVKAFDGLVEVIGGIAVLLIPRGTIEHWSQRIASHELYEGHSFIAHHVTHAIHERPTAATGLWRSFCSRTALSKWAW